MKVPEDASQPFISSGPCLKGKTRGKQLACISGRITLNCHYQVGYNGSPRKGSALCCFPGSSIGVVTEGRDFWE